MTEFVRDLPPFDVDVTNSVYSVVNWTNVAGMQIPSVFRVVQHSPLAGAHRERVYEGVVRSIRPICEVTDFFTERPVAMPTRVIDNRLITAKYPFRNAIYLSESGEIVKNLDELEQRQMDSTQPAKPAN